MKRIFFIFPLPSSGGTNRRVLSLGVVDAEVRLAGWFGGKEGEKEEGGGME